VMFSAGFTAWNIFINCMDISLEYNMFSFKLNYDKLFK
jgi:hypothetical protein